MGNDRAVAPISGKIDGLATAFRRLPSQRLVIVGEPGAGKTVLAIRLLLDLIADARPVDPVPVMLSITSWEPRAASLRRWLAARLAIEHPALGADAGDGRTVATALVDEGRILPVLDGLDEMPSQLRAVAIRTLNASLHIGDPLVLTCRSSEYVAAVAAADSITAAGVVELQPLALDEIAPYLPRTAPPASDSSTKWDRVLAHLRDQPDDPRTRTILAALRTPLMISLAREAYSDGPTDPGELLTDPRFDRVDSTTDHLLDRSISVAYHEFVPSASGRWKASRSRRWLATIATWLHTAHTYDLAWWRLADTAPSTVVATTGAVVGGVAMLLACWSAGNAVVITTAAVVGAVLGAIVNLHHRSVPSTVRLSLSGGAARLRRSVLGLRLTSRRPTSTGWIAWVVGAGILAITVGLRAGWGSAGLGVASLGLVRLLDAWFEAPAEVDGVPGPEALLRIDRNATLSRAALRAAVIGGTAALLSSPAIGGALGLAAFAVSVGFTAWGRFILVRSWYSMSDRLPWRLMAFLRDARARGVLRQAGAVYQFRHAQLQDHLVVETWTDPCG
jgi:hypothetical protein